ncbi:cyclophilin-like domain-containing protein, partial [Delphinella strobiligena]
SALYNLEPQPTAKVLLNTTAGDLVLELWGKQAPLATRNFLQHCLDGYYDGTIFHRLVPGFIIQGGDPSGLGTGGISAIDDGAPFQDEFHSRLKFNRRGLLGMANTGPNDNTSQFFLTLDQTPELQGKNTMFGRIEGDTIYNLMKMAEADLTEEGGDRPLYPTSITGTEILLNPFDDMVKRMHIATRTKEGAPKAVKKKRKAGKNLLSFGADDGEDAAPPVPKKAKVNPNFVAAPQEEARPEAKKPNRRASPSASSPSPPPDTRKSSQNQAPEIPTKPAEPEIEPELDPKPKPKPKVQPPPEEKQISKLDKVNQQIAELKASMKRNTGPAKPVKEEKKSALEAMIPATSTRGRKRGKATGDRSALDLFNSFKQRLEHMPASTSETASPKPDEQEEATAKESKSAANAAATAMDTEEKLCDLHFIANCQSCTSWDKEAATADDDDEDENDGDWMSHQLSFAKDTLGKDLEWRRKMDEFDVIDPREKAKELGIDRKKDK